VIERKNRAKRLIEDFMIAANGVTASFLEKSGFRRWRVLRSPERWERIVALAAARESACRRSRAPRAWAHSREAPPG
jgi:exoribonuclease-2